MKLKLEHKAQRVLPFWHFLARLGKYAIFAFGLVAFSVLLGMFGYHYAAHLSWLDSFHMSCLILTGMGPVAEMKGTSAKLFDSFYALYSGVAFLSIVAVFFAPIVHRLLHILHVDDKN